MRTSEFREAIKELGFTVDGNCDYGFNIDNERDTIACVSDKVEYNIDTDWFEFEETELEKREELLSILVEYASTPIAEREEEKRYRLKLIAPSLTETSNIFLNKVINKTEYFLDDEEESPYCKVAFTESELKDIDETGFKRVEVTE